jgi:hypothetical protein
VPGYLIQQGATVLCLHGGQAQPTAANPRVKLGGQATLQQPQPWTVSGCAKPTPPPPPPCVTAQWLTAATRVRSGGLPLLLQDSQALCTPTGTGLNVVVTQLRVKAQ